MRGLPGVQGCTADAAGTRCSWTGSFTAGPHRMSCCHHSVRRHTPAQQTALTFELAVTVKRVQRRWREVVAARRAARAAAEAAAAEAAGAGTEQSEREGKVQDSSATEEQQQEAAAMPPPQQQPQGAAAAPAQQQQAAAVQPLQQQQQSRCPPSVPRLSLEALRAAAEAARTP